MDYYIRFGILPENERSQVFGPYGGTDDDPVYEKGVSVYSAKRNDKKGRWELMGSAFESESFYPTMSSLLSCDRRIFLVTGDQVGIGTDGEPVIRNVKIVEELSINDLYNDLIYSKEDILLSEDALSLNIDPILVLFKQPRKAPQFIEIEPTTKNIRSLINHEYYEVSHIGGGHFLLFPALEGYENFEQNLSSVDSVIKGNIIILRIISPQTKEYKNKIKKYSKRLKWPWSEEILNEDPSIDTSALEFSSIDKKLTSKILQFVLNSDVYLRINRKNNNNFNFFTMFDNKNILSSGAYVYNIKTCEVCGDVGAKDIMTVEQNGLDLIYNNLKEIEFLPYEIFNEDDNICDDCL